MRLLIVRLSAMGDVIHALPLAKNARQAGATVGWVVERAFAGLLGGNPDCDRVIVADTKRWRRRPLSPSTPRGMASLRRELRAFAPERTIDAQGLWKSAAIARIAGAPTVGFAASQRREPASALLSALRITPGPEETHIVDRNLSLLAALGIPATARAPDARYLLSPADRTAQEFLAARPRPFAILHPGAARAEKMWGEERLSRLAHALSRERGLHIVISWGPGDSARVQRMRTLLPDAAVAPRLDFAGLAQMSAAAALFIAGDTGPLHLADAVGCATLALFGPTNPARNGPYRDRRGVVTAMREVSDETVLQRALSLLRS